MVENVFNEKLMWELGELKFNYLRAVSVIESLQKRVDELEASIQKPVE